jgi:hypothetical protein
MGSSHLQCGCVDVVESRRRRRTRPSNTYEPCPGRSWLQRMIRPNPPPLSSIIRLVESLAHVVASNERCYFCLNGLSGVQKGRESIHPPSSMLLGDFVSWAMLLVFFATEGKSGRRSHGNQRRGTCPCALFGMTNHVPLPRGRHTRRVAGGPGAVHAFERGVKPRLILYQ